MRKARKQLASLLLAAGAVTAPLALSAAPAAAANGGVYVVTPTWWGWCSGSSVTGVYWFNQTTGGSGGDTGDDIAWIPVNLNTSNELTLTVQCANPQRNGATYTFIRPTRNGQTWFIGSGGGTSHN